MEARRGCHARLLWAKSRTPAQFGGDFTHHRGPVICVTRSSDLLRGFYDALTLQRLYTSAQNKTGRDQLPNLPHFANLMVANGKVYIGTNSSLEVYGSF